LFILLSYSYCQERKEAIRTDISRKVKKEMEMKGVCLTKELAGVQKLRENIPVHKLIS
jgi:hypothetical protein